MAFLRKMQTALQIQLDFSAQSMILKIKSAREASRFHEMIPALRGKAQLDPMRSNLMSNLRALLIPK